jgi:FkbM family methyltransferase
MANREKTTLKLIKLARSLFANTPVAKLDITTRIYRSLFNSAYSRQDVEVSYQGVRLVVPTKDITITPGIIGGYYEKHELDIFKELSKSAHNVLDVGGNIGLYACVAGANLPKSARCYSFEPVAENVDYLKKNIVLNKLKNVQIVEEAVGDLDGEVDIYLSATEVGTHSASSAHLGKERASIKVKLTSLDSFAKQRKLLSKVDVLKIDVEGFDGNVIMGAQELIAKSAPTMFVEFIPALLEGSGFKLSELDDLLFSKYKYVFSINEPRNEMRELSTKDVRNSKNYLNINLILTNSIKHRNIIRGHLGL